jgi:ribonuclease P protein component
MASAAAWPPRGAVGSSPTVVRRAASVCPLNLFALKELCGVREDRMTSASSDAVLKKRAAFLAVAATGKKWVAPGLVVQFGTRREAFGVRYGLTASKKVGNAVERNRARRRLRALAREILLSEAKPDRDYVLIARAGTLRRAYKDLQADLRTALQHMRAAA